MKRQNVWLNPNLHSRLPLCQAASENKCLISALKKFSNVNSVKKNSKSSFCCSKNICYRCFILTCSVRAANDPKKHLWSIKICCWINPNKTYELQATVAGRTPVIAGITTDVWTSVFDISTAVERIPGDKQKTVHISFFFNLLTFYKKGKKESWTPVEAWIPVEIQLLLAQNLPHSHRYTDAPTANDFRNTLLTKENSLMHQQLLT